MAIQFPNFLGAQTHAPDYSSIGDIFENFYKGYNMPKDALIKEIQAKFAEPNARENLKSTQLSNANQQILNQFLPEREQLHLKTGNLANRKVQMEINKLAYELAQQKALEDQFKQALAGGNLMQGNQMLPIANPEARQLPPQIPEYTPINQSQILPGTPQGMPVPPKIPGMSLLARDMGLQGNASSQQVNAPIAPQQVTQPEPSNEVIVTKGSPQLAGVDLMWERNPLSHAFLEKKGYKKTQDIKFDNKSGQTTVITKYPSGKISIQSYGNIGGNTQDGLPLTNKMISAHQEKIAAIDNAIPVLKEILALDKANEKGEYKKGEYQWEPYPRSSGYRPGLGWVPGYQSESKYYEELVNSVLDTLMKAYGMPSTNESIESIRGQMLIGHNETDERYRKRLKHFIEDLERRREYSSKEIKRSNKIQPINTSSNENETYSSDEWETV